MIEILMSLYLWFKVNGPAVASAVVGLLTVAETITRLTPTKTDDTFVERIGTYIRKGFDILGIPNRARGGEIHYDANEVMVVPKPEVLAEEKKAS